MALNGSVKTDSYQGRYYSVSWEATQDINTNKSTVKWTLKASGGSASWYAERTLKVNVTSSNTLSGTTSYSKTSRVERYTGTIKSGTFTVAHDANGDASFTIKIQAAVYVSTVNCTGSTKFTLNNIPRKSTLSVGNGTLGTAQTLTVTKKSSSFSHTIVATCGSASTTIANKTTGTSTSFTPPIAWASQNTAGTSVSVVYTITTYNGSTSVGSNSYTVSCSIPASVKPSCTVSVTDAMGYEAIYGGYIKGLSKFYVVVTPTTSYSSPIASYSTTANGGTYTSASFTTGVLSSYGSLTVNATVKDKRGRSGSASVTKNVLNYSYPTISKLAVERCDAVEVAAGQFEYVGPNEKGGFVKVTFSASITGLNNKNSASYVLKYKKTSEAAYSSDQTITLPITAYSVTDAIYVFEADTGSAYDVHLEVSDNFKTIPLDTSVSTAFTLMHFGASGHSIGFGKIVEEEDVLDVGLKTKLRDQVLIGEKEEYLDGNTGIYMSPEGYMHIQRSGEDVSPYIGFMRDNATTNQGLIMLNKDQTMSFANSAGYAFDNDVYLPNGCSIRMKNSNGSYRRMVIENSSNQAFYGYDSRECKEGASFYDGHSIYLRSNTHIYMQSPSAGFSGYREFGVNRLLWSGALYMNASQTATLTEAVSTQLNGIVLVFSNYNSDTGADNAHWHFHFVPKRFVATHPGNGVSIFCPGPATISTACYAKYVYVHDTKITGNDANDDASTERTSGIKATNSRGVLRYVIGV